MKILEHTSTIFTLRESAGCLWLLGFFFIAIAGTFVAGLLGLFTNLDELNELEKLGAWVISLSGVAAGVWVIYTHPGVYVSFDKSTNSATIKRKGFLKNETETHRLSEIEDVVLNESVDSEGDPFYRIAIKLKRGRQVILFSTGLNDKEGQQNKADLIKSFLRNN
jgi:hypothetical protein